MKYTNTVTQTLCTLTLICAGIAHAERGTNSGGGGHEIEAGFKTKLISLAKEAQDMLPGQKRYLKFDPDAFAARLTIPNGLSPLCASGDELTQLRQLNKMAYVTNPSSGVVNLDCSDYPLSQWQSLFDSQEMGNNVFFIHEGLRILETENENDYSISSSYTAAVKADPQYESKNISSTMEHLLSAPEGSKCFLRIPIISNLIDVFLQGSNRSHGPEFVINGKVVDSMTTQYFYKVEDIRTSLIQVGPVNDTSMEEFRVRVAARAAQGGCI